MSSAPTRKRKSSSKAAAVQQALDALKGLREAGAEYPPTLGRLAELCGVAQGPKVVAPFNSKEFKAATVAAAPTWSAPVALADNVNELANSERLLRFVVQTAEATDANPLSVPELLKRGKLHKDLKTKFGAATEGRLAEGRLPADLKQLVVVPVTPATVAARLLVVIESQRRLGGESYPLRVERLVQLAERSFDKLTKDALKQQTFVDRTVVAGPAAHAVVALSEDAATQLPASQPLFQILFDAAQKERAKQRTNAFRVEALAACLPKGQATFKQTFVEVTLRKIDEGRLPAGYGSLKFGKSRLVFRVADIEPPPVPPPPAAQANAPVGTKAATPTSAPTVAGLGDFAPQFEQAFHQIDSQMGRKNLVKVAELRRKLPSFSREQFDAGLRALRLAQKYTMNSSDGNTVTLSDEERSAGILEAGSLLVYVSRKGHA